MPRMKTTPHIDKLPGKMTPAQLVDWRKAHGFSQQDAAAMLGMSRRPYQYLEGGETRGGFRPPTIPRTVELAIKGLDVELRLLRYRAGGRSLVELRAAAGG